jgi:hypothetical protein
VPIYEFFCPDCHTVYSFLSNSIGGKRKPPCPSGERQHRLQKRPSTFATLRPSSEELEGLGPFSDLSEDRLGDAFESMAQEMERFGDSDDPGTVARALERFGELSGMELGPRMRDVLARLEQGEDAATIEKELESIDDGGDPELSDFFKIKRLASRSRQPRVDPELYFLD